MLFALIYSALKEVPYKPGALSTQLLSFFRLDITTGSEPRDEKMKSIDSHNSSRLAYLNFYGWER